MGRLQMIKVLIVDDERLVVENITESIQWESMGFVLSRPAYNGKSAIRIFEEERPDLVITDIKMPGMDGLELSRELLKRKADIQIILLTAYKDFEYAKKAIELGVSRYIVKNDIQPDSMRELLMEVREDIRDHKTNDRILRREKCKNLLEKGAADAELQKELMTSSMRIAQYMIILPYGYFDDLLRQTEELSEDTRVLDSLIQEYDGICGFFIRFQCVFLMEEVPEEITGEMQIRQYMYEKAGEFQGKLREDGEDSGLIIMGYRKQKEKGCMELYQRLKKMSEYFRFMQEGKIYMESDLQEKVSPGVTEKEWDMEVLNDNFRNHQAEKITEDIGQMYQTVREPVWDKNGLITLTEKLRNHLNDLCRRSPGVRFEMLLQQEAGRSIFLDEIRDRMTEIYRKANRMVQNGKEAQYSIYIRKCIQYIEEHYSEEINIETVAGTLDISGVYLSQLCRKELSQSFLELLTGTRIKMAKKLLQQMPQMKMYEIAEAVRYRSSQYFASVFKKAEGMTPWEYRSRNS